jgi:hypothetical protein
MYVSLARVQHPLTRSNWEGIGVAPDLPCPAAEALKKAHAMALDYLKQREQQPAIQLQYEKLKKQL